MEVVSAAEHFTGPGQPIPIALSVLSVNTELPANRPDKFCLTDPFLFVRIIMSVSNLCSQRTRPTLTGGPFYLQEKTLDYVRVLVMPNQWLPYVESDLNGGESDIGLDLIK